MEHALAVTLVGPGVESRRRWVLRAGDVSPYCREAEVISFAHSRGPVRVGGNVAERSAKGALIWCRDNNFATIRQQEAPALPDEVHCERIWKTGRHEWQWVDDDGNAHSSNRSVDAAVVGLSRFRHFNARDAALFARRLLGALLDRKIQPVWRTRTPSNLLHYTQQSDAEAAAASIARELNVSVIDLGGPASHALRENARLAGNNHLDIYRVAGKKHLAVGACANPLVNSSCAPSATGRNGALDNVIMADGVHFCTDYAAHWAGLVFGALGVTRRGPLV